MPKIFETRFFIFQSVMIPGWGSWTETAVSNPKNIPQTSYTFQDKFLRLIWTSSLDQITIKPELKIWFSRYKSGFSSQEQRISTIGVNYKKDLQTRPCEGLAVRADARLENECGRWKKRKVGIVEDFTVDFGDLWKGSWWG